MRFVSAWLRSFAEATVDVGLSVLALLLVLVPTLGVVHALLGSPIDQGTFDLWLLIGAVVLAYPFANRLLSRGWLGTYVLGFWGGIVAFAVVWFLVVAETGFDPFSDSSIWPALLVAQGHAIALTIVYLDDVRLVPLRNRGAIE